MSGRADYTTNTILVQEEVTNNIGAVSLLGRNVEVISTFFNAEAITVSTPVLNFDKVILKAVLSKYKEMFVKVISTLDNATHNVGMEILTLDAGTGTGDPRKAHTDYSGARFIYSPSDFKSLSVGGLVDLNFMIDCANAPTSGSITLILYGVPN